MKTKEAIDICEKRHDYGLYSSSAYNISKFHDAIDKIIESSKQGEKYQQMWEKLKEKSGFRHIDHPFVTHQVTIEEIMESYEQKYFPKEVKKSV